MKTAYQEPPAAPTSAAIPPAFDWRILGWNAVALAPETLAARPQPSLVKLTLTLEGASTLYVVLRGKTHLAARPKSVSAKPTADLARLLVTLENSLHRLPATAPPGTTLTLELPSQDAAYLRATVGNKKRDEWRYEQVRSRGVVSLDTLMEQAEAAGETGIGVSIPVDSDRPERAFRHAEIKRALAGLPDELAALLGPLSECGGNVSALARRLGQPQRKTARQVTRIRQRLEKLCLGPV